MIYRVEFNNASRAEIVKALRELANTLEVRVDGLEQTIYRNCDMTRAGPVGLFNHGKLWDER